MSCCVYVQGTESEFSAILPAQKEFIVTLTFRRHHTGFNAMATILKFLTILSLTLCFVSQ